MNTVCHPSMLQGVRDATRPSWLTGLQRVWVHWRAQARQQAEWRVLEQLGESTRRDIGLADRTPIASKQALWQHERGLW